MNTDKFTLRDFFVFFLSGISLLFGLCITQFEWMIGKYKEIESAHAELILLIKSYPTMFGLLSIPMLYLIGQLIHGVDDFVFTHKWIDKLDRQGKNQTLVSRVYKLLIGYRVIGYVWINFKKEDLGKKENSTLDKLSREEYKLKRREIVEQFWQDFYTLQSQNLSLACEYWYIMNELFKGLTLVCLMLFILACFTGKYCILMFIIMVISRKRAHFFAQRFYFSVSKTLIGFSEQKRKNA